MAQKRETRSSVKSGTTRSKHGILRSNLSGRIVTTKKADASSKAAGKGVRPSVAEDGDFQVHPADSSQHAGSGRRAASKQGDVVRARIDPAVKEEASAVLATMGLTVSDAFRLLMMRVATEKTLPFSPLIPNEETIAAMRAARRGEVETIGGIDALFSSLDADD